MAQTLSTKAEVFLDTAYAIALSAKNDDFHNRAIRLADWLEASGTSLVTTQAVMLEIGNALSNIQPPGVARYPSASQLTGGEWRTGSMPPTQSFYQVAHYLSH